MAERVGKIPNTEFGVPTFHREENQGSVTVAQFADEHLAFNAIFIWAGLVKNGISEIQADEIITSSLKVGRESWSRCLYPSLRDALDTIQIPMPKEKNMSLRIPIDYSDLARFEFYSNLRASGYNDAEAEKIVNSET